MRRRHTKSTILFIICLVFALFSLPDSAALNSGSLERKARVLLAEDKEAAFELKGLDGRKAYNLNKNYAIIGTIRNNGNNILILSVMVSQDSTMIKNKNYEMGIRIGGNTVKFCYNSISSQRIDILLIPGQAMDIQAAISRNQSKEVTTSFDFTAADIGSAYTVVLGDTDRSPRRFLCY